MLISPVNPHENHTGRWPKELGAHRSVEKVGLEEFTGEIRRKTGEGV